MQTQRLAPRDCLLTFLLALSPLWNAAAQDRLPSNLEQILADEPAVVWTFEDGVDSLDIDGRLAALEGRAVGACRPGSGGPRPPHYPSFAGTNGALSLDGRGSYLRVPDPVGAGIAGSRGESQHDSVLDFRLGDSITIEAWVNPAAIVADQQVYIVGKGRTQNEGFARDNQNFALRLRGQQGVGRLSFLFRSKAAQGSGTRDNFHRWNSTLGVAPDGMWHHVAVVYTFGKPQSIRGYVDGQETSGSWDIGGATTAAPVVDDDDLWIGSSMGGSSAASFQGGIDDLAIYRRELPAERLIARYRAAAVDPLDAELAAAEDLPTDQVLVELFDKTPASQQWSLHRPAPTLRYGQQGFGWTRVPHRYLERGVRGDWQNTLMLRARSRLRLDASAPVHFLLRYKTAARLYLDGKLIAQTGQMSRNASGHEKVPPRKRSRRPDVHMLLPGMQEQIVKLDVPAGEHLVRLDAVVGGSGVRLELGQLSVGIAVADGPMRLLAAGGGMSPRLDEPGWQKYRDELAVQMRELDARHRRLASQDWREYWNYRHELAREVASSQPPLDVPQPIGARPEGTAVDRFVDAALAQRGVRPAPDAGDTAFLRRVTLDIAGVVPSREEVEGFLAQPRGERRAAAIERLLDDPRWADHWVAYWQDVLAENPGILKPKLNNTGPFRWWIYESFLDNKPMDQFVTELVLMEGSKYAGGPAGFAMATENDAPMAAKAHVLAQAFLGLDMTCARCHDAPYHPFKQEQLFNLAAMLGRKPTQLPKTSTVPTGEGGRRPLVEISLKPGQTIDPAWPFSHLGAELPEGLLTNSQDQREQLAARITSPHNRRFAKVIVNRLWQRYLGRGLVEPIDDWESDAQAAASSPLLDFLARQLVLHDYDLKHVARLILNSHAYQRQPQAVSASESLPVTFAAPARRRMSAEQLVDSLFVISGKRMNAEALTLDPEGRRPSSTFLNLGVPRRSWQFTSLSNERDRPALALPMAQSMIDLLTAYGWRDSRPNPISVRNDDATMLQPLTLANGVIGRRAVTLSDDHAITALCLQEQTVDNLVRDVYLQVLSRPPTDQEAAPFIELLADGYATRVVAGQPVTHPPPVYNPVSWSNHLNAEATKLKHELERSVLAGDLPTRRLNADWRQRMEDVVWALMNSPEFAFVP